MRTVFFFALLANVVYFLWQYQQGALEPQAPSAVEADGEKQILLLAEAEQGRAQDTTGLEVGEMLEKDAVSPSAESLKELEMSLNIDVAKNEKEKTVLLATLDEKDRGQCYQVGVFSNQAAIDQWADRLGIDSALLQVQQRNKSVITGYLVYYPAETSFKESEKNLKMLRSLGIKEAWLFRKGELKGDISLGMFKTRAKAVELQKEFFSKSIYAAVKPRYKVPPEFHVKLQSDKSPQQLKALLKGLVRKPSITPLAECY